MIRHRDWTDRELRAKIKQGSVRFGGNKRLGIYGTLRCRSGKRMKRANRVFFSTREEAEKKGYRPCGHCMKEEYLRWKTQQ